MYCSEDMLAKKNILNLKHKNTGSLCQTGYDQIMYVSTGDVQQSHHRIMYHNLYQVVFRKYHFCQLLNLQVCSLYDWIA